jgi:glucosamine--fructose-6-phosphate aminotransferase (isomerizing)
MCGIFGIVSGENINTSHLHDLALHARQRGRDSSGLFYVDVTSYQVKRADYDIKKLINTHSSLRTSFIMGHSRLITNGLLDNQPVVRDGLVLIHNGIIVNDERVWQELPVVRQFEIDSEVILGLTLQHFKEDGDTAGLSQKILAICKGTISAALAIPSLGKLILFSNNGSLYVGKNNQATYFSSERYPLENLRCEAANQSRYLTTKTAIKI